MQLYNRSKHLHKQDSNMTNELDSAKQCYSYLVLTVCVLVWLNANYMSLYKDGMGSCGLWDSISSSDFVENSYGEPWNLLVKNNVSQSRIMHWVPVQKTMSPKLKMLGPLCRQLIWRHAGSKTLYNITQCTVYWNKKSHFFYCKAQLRLKEIRCFISGNIRTFGKTKLTVSLRTWH